MARILKRIAVGGVIGGITLLLLSAAAYVAGARINTTRSIPLGLYWTSSAPLEVGAYVLFCPPPLGLFDEARARDYIGAGFCPRGYGFMMKRVLAAKDDVISVTDDGVRINGRLLTDSAPSMADKAGRSLPRYQASHYILGNSELLLMSDASATSFDGRYFGPINRSQVRTVIRPVITW